MSKRLSCTKGMERPFAYLGFCLCHLCLASLIFGSCGDSKDLSEEMSDPSPVEYLLTLENHLEGYGLSECLFCHPIFQIHQKSSNPDVNLEDIRETVEELGQDSCMFCHGRNGT